MRVQLGMVTRGTTYFVNVKNDQGNRTWANGVGTSVGSTRVAFLCRTTFRLVIPGDEFRAGTGASLYH